MTNSVSPNRSEKYDISAFFSGVGRLNSSFIVQSVKFIFLCLTRRNFMKKDQTSLDKDLEALNLGLKN